MATYPTSRKGKAVNREEIQDALAVISRALYRGSAEQREEIRDQLLSLARMADNYNAPKQGDHATHLQMTPGR